MKDFFKNMSTEEKNLIDPALLDLYDNKNLLSKLTKKLSNKFKTSFSPQTNAAKIVKGKELCLQAQKVLAKNAAITDIERYDLALSYLKLAYECFCRSGDTTLTAKAKKSIENVKTLLTKTIKNLAYSTLQTAIELLRENSIAKSKSAFVAALNLYKQIDDKAMIDQTCLYILSCDYYLVAAEAKFNLKSAELSLFDAKFFSAADKMISAPKQAIELFERAIDSLEQSIGQDNAIFYRQKIVDCNNAMADKYYQVGYNKYYSNKKIDVAIDELKTAMEYYKKANNKKNIELCGNLMADCYYDQGIILMQKAREFDCVECLTDSINYLNSAIDNFTKSIHYSYNGNKDYLAQEKIFDCKSKLNEYKSHSTQNEYKY